MCKFLLLSCWHRFFGIPQYRPKKVQSLFPAYTNPTNPFSGAFKWCHRWRHIPIILSWKGNFKLNKSLIYTCLVLSPRVREARGKDKGGKLKEKPSGEKSASRSHRKRSPSPKKSTKGKVAASRGRDKRRRRASSSRYKLCGCQGPLLQWPFSSLDSPGPADTGI